MTHVVSYHMVTIRDDENIDSLIDMAKELRSHLIQPLYVKTSGQPSEAPELHALQVNVLANHQSEHLQ